MNTNKPQQAPQGSVYFNRATLTLPSPTTVGLPAAMSLSQSSDRMHIKSLVAGPNYLGLVGNVLLPGPQCGTTAGREVVAVMNHELLDMLREEVNERAVADPVEYGQYLAYWAQQLGLTAADIQSLGANGWLVEWVEAVFNGTATLDACYKVAAIISLWACFVYATYAPEAQDRNISKSATFGRWDKAGKALVNVPPATVAPSAPIGGTASRRPLKPHKQ
jgi:hypothetical protein